MYEEQLYPRGDHYVLAIEGDFVRKEWKIDESARLTLEIDGNRLIVTAHMDPDRERKFREALKRVNEKWGDMLRRLAQDD